MRLVPVGNRSAVALDERRHGAREIEGGIDGAGAAQLLQGPDHTASAEVHAVLNRVARLRVVERVHRPQMLGREASQGVVDDALDSLARGTLGPGCRSQRLVTRRIVQYLHRRTLRKVVQPARAADAGSCGSSSNTD